MHGYRSARIPVAALLVALLACSDDTTSPATSFTASLRGSSEVPPTTSTATGSATCNVDAAASTISCTVTYAGLSGNPTASHIHLGNANATGAVRVNLCGAGTAPACPAAVSGTITSGAQAATGATFATVVNAMRQYGAYVNIHTAANAGGEIRGQIFGVY